MYKLPASIIFIFAYIVLANCDNDLMVESDSLDNSEKYLSNYLQKIDDIPSIPIIGDYILLEKSQDAVEEKTKEEEDFIEKCARFLATRSLKIKFPSEEARGLLAEGRKRKIRKFLLPLLLILKLKAAIILPIVLSIIAFVSFKGFGLSLAALAVAGTTALKNLLEHAGSKVSYEVVPAPIGQWSRSAAPEGSASVEVQYDY